MRDEETRELEARTSLVGVEGEERQRVAADFFERLPWEPPKLDPAAMTAGEFLDAL
jgi:hypothetical protein